MRDGSVCAKAIISQELALQLSSCASKADFIEKHNEGALQFPLFCNVRLTREVKQVSVSEGLHGFVSHQVQELVPVDWSPDNAATSSPTFIAINSMLQMLQINKFICCVVSNCARTGGMFFVNGALFGVWVVKKLVVS